MTNEAELKEQLKEARIELRGVNRQIKELHRRASLTTEDKMPRGAYFKALYPLVDQRAILEGSIFGLKYYLEHLND